MTDRLYNPMQLVTLPRLKAHEVLALARALLAKAKQATPLPPSLTEAVVDLEAAVVALAEALATRDRKVTVPVREADLVEDNAVAALVDILKAWMRLPRESFPEEVGVAERCLDVILEGGTLHFLTYKPLVEHSEVQRRIDGLQAKGLDQELRALGMGPFVDHLLAAHMAYGDACGVTRALPKDDAPDLRAVATEVNDSMREYVVRVVATVNRRDASSGERADALLLPLTQWISATPSARSEEEGEDEEGEDAKKVEAPANDATKAAPKDASKDAPKSVPAAPAANDAEGQRKVG